jgi:protein-S-isoprenylcysteine O-methyltransferase Ste14
MTENKTLLSAAIFCFASFAWGMLWHFRRLGKPSRTMLITALLALASAVLQLFGLSCRPLRYPFIALTLYAAGVALFWWAAGVTRRKLAACGQGCVSAEVITGGPYRLIRHPFYAAYILIWIAGFAATLWWPLACAAVAMAVRYDRAAREEELGFAASPLGAAYSAYQQRTGMYWPRLGNGRRSARGAT